MGQATFKYSCTGNELMLRWEYLVPARQWPARQSIELLSGVFFWAICREGGSTREGGRVASEATGM